MRAYREGAIGGGREADPWVIPALAGDRRRVRRLACKAAAGFRESQRMRVEVEIANLSPHGCAVRSAETKPVGTRCWITLPTLESWSAQVAWSNGALFGVAFSRPLHRAVADMIVARTGSALPWSSPIRLLVSPSRSSLLQ